MTTLSLTGSARSLCLSASLLVMSGADAWAGDPAHAESSGGLPQLDFSTYPSQIFWLAIFFVTLYGIFARKILPNISSTIEGRQEHIRNDLDNADDLKKEAEDVKDAYEAILDEAHNASMKSFSEVEAKIKKKTDKASQDFLAQSAKDIEKTEKSVQKAKDKVFDDIDAIAAEVSSKAAERIIGAKVDVGYAQSVVQSLQGKKKAA